MADRLSATTRCLIAVTASIATFASLYLLAAIFGHFLTGTSDPNELSFVSQATLVCAICALQASMVISLIVMYRHSLYDRSTRMMWTAAMLLCVIVAVPCFLMFIVYGSEKARFGGLIWFALASAVLVSLFLAVFSLCRTVELFSIARNTPILEIPCDPAGQADIPALWRS